MKPRNAIYRAGGLLLPGLPTLLAALTTFVLFMLLGPLTLLVLLAHF